MILKPIRNHIVFQFENEKTKHMNVNQFLETTDWGFNFVRSNEGVESPRWARVIAVGDECDAEIQPGSRICIDSLKWTLEFNVGSDVYWRTDSDQVLLIEQV